MIAKPRHKLWLGLGFASAALVLLALGAGVYYLQKPTVLRVAVTGDSDDFAIMNAASQDFAKKKSSIHLKLVPVETLAETAKALEEGHSDLSIVRSDVALPVNGQTVLIMRKNAAVLIAPAQDHFHKVADLRGKTIGILQHTVHTGGANQSLLDVVLEQYGIPVDSVKTVPLTLGQLPDALKQKQIDALLAIGPQGGGLIADAASDVGKFSHKAPVFIPISEAEAIAKRSPNFESITIVKGIFGGAQPKPAADFDTLGVTTRLMARSSLANNIAGDLTRKLLEARPFLASQVPLANKIEAPDTDKGSALQVHPGTIAYLDDDEESFFDKYGDMIYIGAMLMSVLGTALVTIRSRLKEGEQAALDDDLFRAVELIALARRAETLAKLAELREEAEDIVGKLIVEAVNKQKGADPGTHRLVALGLVRDELRSAITARQSFLETAARVGFSPRLISEEPKATPSE